MIRYGIKIQGLDVLRYIGYHIQQQNSQLKRESTTINMNLVSVQMHTLHHALHTNFVELFECSYFIEFICCSHGSAILLAILSPVTEDVIWNLRKYGM